MSFNITINKTYPQTKVIMLLGNGLGSGLFFVTYEYDMN